MPELVFGAVADDDTGATDLAGMLAEAGLRTVLVIDIPPSAAFASYRASYDAVIIGAATRALTPREAYQRTHAAAGLLREAGARVIEVKYCSTFDSTAEGNIGPSIDAAMDALKEDFTVALPALPVNGRTTYMGHHFVGAQLLSDSPMRQHPLTPMTNPNLVSHLQCQTRRRVGLASYPVTRAKLELLRADGTEIAVLDCISDEDLTSVCEAIASLPLITGSSAPAMRLPAIWQREGWWSGASESRPLTLSTGRGTLLIAGSCSQATRRQNAYLALQGIHQIVLHPVVLAEGGTLDSVVSEAGNVLSANQPCLMRTAYEPEDLQAVRQWAASHHLTGNEAGLRIAYGLASLARKVVAEHPPAGLIVAGGETAGAVCRSLELGALEVRRNIEPGVPLCISLAPEAMMPVVLKSGNFGSEDFYRHAIAACQAARSA